MNEENKLLLARKKLKLHKIKKYENRGYEIIELLPFRMLLKIFLTLNDLKNLENTSKHLTKE